MRSGVALQRQRRVHRLLVNPAYLLAAIGLGLLVPQISVGVSVESRRVTEMVAVVAAFVPFIALLFLVVQFNSTAFTPTLNLFRDSPCRPWLGAAPRSSTTATPVT